jgi:hypothetical protein
MKKISMLFCAGVLVSTLGAAVTACNNEPKGPNNEEFPEGGIKPVLPLYAGEAGSEADKEVAAFFEKHLPAVSGGRSDCLFVGDNENKSLMINSVDEFRKFISSAKLPTIDFDAYTLIVGQYWVGGTAYRVFENNVNVGLEKIVLNLTVGKPNATYAVMCPVYYWGLYQKLPKKPIEVDVVFKDYIFYPENN